jgi:hypothetical protein
MILLVNKDTRLNLRITPAFRAKLELLAEYHGLKLSSYVHSLLVKAVRKEREDLDLPDNGEQLVNKNISVFKPERKKRRA